jgi:hypothetical protein
LDVDVAPTVEGFAFFRFRDGGREGDGMQRLEKRLLHDVPQPPKLLPQLSLMLSLSKKKQKLLRMWRSLCSLRLFRRCERESS